MDSDSYYNASWQVLEVRKNDDEDPLKRYVWSVRYIDEPVVRFYDGNTDGDVDDEEDNTVYYCVDANQNVTTLATTWWLGGGQEVERYHYDPYGRVHVFDGSWQVRTTDVYDNDILYCGYLLDRELGGLDGSTGELYGLYHVRHRAYHPALGRWLQRDPAGYVDGMSLYQYVGSMPTRHLDALGLVMPLGNGAVVHSTGSVTYDPSTAEGSRSTPYDQPNNPARVRDEIEWYKFAKQHGIDMPKAVWESLETAAEKLEGVCADYLAGGRAPSGWLGECKREARDIARAYVSGVVNTRKRLGDPGSGVDRNSGMLANLRISLGIARPWDLACGTWQWEVKVAVGRAGMHWFRGATLTSWCHATVGLYHVCNLPADRPDAVLDPWEYGQPDVYTDNSKWNLVMRGHNATPVWF